MPDDDANRHDIQNQLAVIQGFAELLLADTAEDDPRRSDFEQIRDAAETALRLMAGEDPRDTDPTS